MDNLSDVIARVRKQTVKGFEHLKRLPANEDGASEIVIRERRQRIEEHIPTLVPFFQQLGAGEIPRLELRIAIAPDLLAVGRQEVRESRLQVSRDVAHDDRNRIPAGIAPAQFIIAGLLQGAIGQNFVTAPLAFDRGNDVSHVL